MIIERLSGDVSNYGRAATFMGAFLCLSACLAHTQASEQTSFLGSKDAADLPDFSYAGYRFGEVALPTAQGTIIDATDYGVIANDALDDSHALLAALAAAHESSSDVIVQLPAGRIIISEILPINRSNIVIRGHGSGETGTELHFPRPLAMVDKSDRLDELRQYLLENDKRQIEPEKNVDFMFSEYSWDGGFIWIGIPGIRPVSYLPELDQPIAPLTAAIAGTRGSRTLTVERTDQLVIGDAVQIQWANAAGPNGPLVKSLYGETDLAIGSRHWSAPERPLVRQTTRILSVRGNTVEIGDPLLHDVSAELPANVAAWEHLEEIGLEDFSITFPNAPSFGHHLERGYNGIYVSSAIDSWVRGVRIVNADSGILTYNSANLTVTDIRSQGERRGHYAVMVGNVHNVLVQDLTVENPVIHPLTVNTQSTKSVIQRATVLQGAVLDQHAGANHQNLFDNITLYINPKRDELDQPYYPLWDGSGAGYWQPGHGRFNTSWNVRVIVQSEAARDETVELRGLEEGPDAFLVGIHGNRNFSVDYRPRPLELQVNEPAEVPSLYDWQLAQRLKKR